MPAFDPRPTNPAECKLLQSVAAEEEAIFSPDAEPLRARVIRHLLLGLPVPGSAVDPSAVGRVGVRVHGARIEGSLSLADCAGPNGTALPPLVFASCDIPGPIDLSGAHLAHFSVKDCRIAHIAARGMRLEGNFDFSGAYGFDPPPIGAEGALPWIDAHGARISGDVEGSGAHLEAPPSRSECEIPPGTHRYALRLSNCGIRGRVALLDGFRALGGVAFSDGDIRGEVWLSRATLTAGEGDAFRSQSTRFGSVLVFDGFFAQGQVWLLGAKIAGTFSCADAIFANPGRVALSADNAEIGGAVLLQNAKASGEVSLRALKLGGHLSAENAEFENGTRRGAGDALIADSAQIGGAAILRRARMSGRVSLIGARIGSHLDCQGAHFENRRGKADGIALITDNAEIGGNMLLRSAATSGQVRLSGATIGGGLSCEGAKFENRTRQGDGDALLAENSKIGGAALLRTATAWGRISLNGAKVGGDLDCTGALFTNRTRKGEGTALTAANTQIGGTAKLRDVIVRGGVSLAGAKISNNFDCGDARFENRTRNGDGIALTATNADISGTALMSGATAAGQVFMYGAKIRGDLLCSEASFGNRIRQDDGMTLVAMNAEIGGDLSLGKAVSVGCINLWGCRIGRNLDTDGARLLARVSALVAPSLRIAGKFSLGETIVLGSLSLPHLDVRGELDWTGLRLPREWAHEGESYSSPEGSELDFRHARIGTQLTAQELISEVPLHIDLGGARVATLNDKWPGGWGGAAALRPDHRVPRGMRVVFSCFRQVFRWLRDAFGRIENPAAPARRVTINLDGFVYDRFGDFPAEPPGSRWAEWWKKDLKPGLVGWSSSLGSALARSAEWVGRRSPWLAKAGRRLARIALPAATFARKQVLLPLDRELRRIGAWIWCHFVPPRHSAKSRLDWLELPKPAGAFFPQPYRHLARVLRAHGHAAAAREVGIGEGWAAPAGSFWYRLLRYPFGLGFGFGLSPQRAFAVLLLFVLIGWYGVDRGLKADAMVLTASPVATVFVPDGGALQAAIQHGDLASARIEVPCTNQIEPFFYSIDLMLPVIPLHEETKCEVSTRPEFCSWRLAKQLFSIIGKIVTALALLTFSGVLNVRPQD